MPFRFSGKVAFCIKRKTIFSSRNQATETNTMEFRSRPNLLIGNPALSKGQQTSNFEKKQSNNGSQMGLHQLIC